MVPLRESGLLFELFGERVGIEVRSGGDVHRKGVDVQRLIGRRSADARHGDSGAGLVGPQSIEDARGDHGEIVKILGEIGRDHASARRQR